MGDLSRIGVSIDVDLLRRFDSYIADKGYENRSEAFRDLIRDRLVDSAVIGPNAFVVGSVTLIYDHHTRLLADKLTEIQHHSFRVITAGLHVHLDEHSCLEVITLRGSAAQIREIADRLTATKGVRYGQLVPATTGKQMR